MQRVAVCIRGELRTWEQCKLNLLNLFDDSVIVDYFFTTWDIDRDVKLDKTECRDVDLGSIKRAFSGKNLVKCSVLKLSELNDCPPTVWLPEWKMFTMWHACNMLKVIHEYEHDFKYDYVVALRPDVICSQAEPLNAEDVRALSAKYHTIRFETSLREEPHPYGLRCGDFLMMGTSPAMDILGDFKNVVKMQEGDNRIFDTPHSFFARYITSHNLLILDSYADVPCGKIDQVVILRPDNKLSVPMHPDRAMMELIYDTGVSWEKTLSTSGRNRY